MPPCSHTRLLLLLVLLALGTRPAGPATITAAGKMRNRSIGVHDAALLSPESSRADGLVGGLVDSEADPGEEASGEVTVSIGVGRGVDESVAHDRVVAVSALAEEEVVDVVGHAHGVGAVGGHGVGRGDEVLVEVELTDVGRTAAGDGVVLGLLRAEVDDG